MFALLFLVVGVVFCQKCHNDGPDPAACDQFMDQLCGGSTGLEKLVCDALDEVCRAIICDIDDVVVHVPFQDYDGDFFSSIFPLRGSAWRGRDCNDTDSSIYPGRSAAPSNPSIDHNCNGIFGANATGTYEDIFCKNSGQIGVAILGDSTGAHFGLPIYPFGTPQHWLDVAENEFCAPQCSWATGFQQDPKDCERDFSGLPPTSIYYKLWQRNHCNFRDYQNVAVNGARSPSIARFSNSTSRNSAKDHPLLTFYSPAANDICNPHKGIGSMTSPEEFYSNNKKILQTIDSFSPPGSSVIMVGLFHGEMIYDSMHNVPYPYFQEEGKLPFTYGDFWAIGDNTVISPNSNGTLNPCWAWLNPLSYWRDLATTQADHLEATFPKLIEDEQKNLKNIKVYYMEHPSKYVLPAWMAKGNPAKHLFEPDDGAHPSQTANVLWADFIWNYMEKNWPEIIGPVNPFNAQIEKMFGNQGGY